MYLSGHSWPNGFVWRIEPCILFLSRLLVMSDVVSVEVVFRSGEVWQPRGMT